MSLGSEPVLANVDRCCLELLFILVAFGLQQRSEWPRILHSLVHAHRAAINTTQSLVRNYFWSQKYQFSPDVFSPVHGTSHPSIVLFHSNTNLSQAKVAYLVSGSKNMDMDMDGSP